MYQHSFVSRYSSTIPLLDEEFDKVENNPLLAEPNGAVHVVLDFDRAWEDQLDEGNEVSL